MKVLVTGGAGFIGSHLVRRLHAEGHLVTVLDNLSTGKRSNLEGVDVELVEGDVRLPDSIAPVIKGCQAVFHLAAVPSVSRSWEDPVGSLAVNALGTANVVEVSVAEGVETLVYSSSSSVYGDQPGSLRSEDMIPNPLSPYACSKLLGEKIALAHAYAKDLRVVALRYFNVFGSRQDPDSPYAAAVPRFLSQALAGGPVTIHGDGNQSRDFTPVANVVRANLLALSAGPGALVVNVGCGRSRSLLDLVGAISALIGAPPRIEYDAPRPGDVRHSLADIRAARSVLGYEPCVSFEEGLRETCEWLQAAQ